jgi:protein AroM
MDVRTVGAVTVGQSPRDDVLPDILELLPRGVQIIERGALDGVDRDALPLLAPAPGETTLITRLRDGEEVAVAESQVLPLLHRAVQGVQAQGAGVVAMLCTGSFPGLHPAGPSLFPGQVVRQLVSQAGPGIRLGIVVPAHGQADAARADWSAVAGELLVLAASPYCAPVGLSEAPEALLRAAQTLAGWQPDLVVLDCLGYTRRMQRLVQEMSGVPVVLPRVALASALAAVV